MCMYVCTCLWYVVIRMCVSIYMHTRVCICVCTCLWYMCVCICIFAITWPHLPFFSTYEALFTSFFLPIKFIRNTNYNTSKSETWNQRLSSSSQNMTKCFPWLIYITYFHRCWLYSVYSLNKSCIHHSFFTLLILTYDHGTLKLLFKRFTLFTFIHWRGVHMSHGVYEGSENNS